MSFWGKVGGAILGAVLAPVTGGMSLGATIAAMAPFALTGAVAGHTLIDKPQEQKEQFEAAIRTQKQTQEQIAAEQLTAQKEATAEQLELEREIAAEQYRLTEKQMKFQMGQQQLELLSNLFLEQDRTEVQTGTRFITLPSIAPSGIIDQINLWFDQILRA